VSGDLVKALEFYSKAADGGNAKAQFILGTAFEFGKFGLEVDLDRVALGRRPQPRG
jgi:TPR repeat protein